MNGQSADLAAICYMASGLGFAFFAIHLIWRYRQSGDVASVSALTIGAATSTSLWAFASTYDRLSPFTAPSFFAAGFDLLRYSLWLAVLLLLLRDNQLASQGRAQWSLPRLAAPAALLVAFSTAILILRIVRGDYEADASRVYLATALTLPLFGLLLVEQVFRNQPDDARWLAKPFCLGLASTFAYDVYLYSESVLLGRLDEDAYSIRGAVHLLVVPLLLLAARRRADWAKTLQVSRRAAFYSATLLLSGGYLLFISAIGYYVRYFGGDWGRALQLGLVSVAFVCLLLLILSASIRAKVRVSVGKHFFSYRYDYREEWLAFTATLSAQSTPSEVGTRIVRGLANMLECPAGSLWTRHVANGPFTQAARWNVNPIDQEEPADSPMCRHLCQRGWIIDLDEHQRGPQAHDGLVLSSWLANSDGHWLVVPLLVAEELLGFVVLARPRTTVDLDWEVRDLLKTAGRQAAGFLAQMQATEALLDARKFDAFNRMSAFVVHDLKNIVTQLSLMMKNAERLHGNAEFQQDMLLTVESSLEKMRRLMLQLREGAAPTGSPRGVEMSPVIRRLERNAAAAGRMVRPDIRESLATRGHEDRLERVLGHLVQNALDATPLEGEVWITVQRYSGQVEVIVGDTGKGMSEEFLQRGLFRPFSTTKETGMGIGTYESAQYIRELGGSISVESALGKGTKVCVRLPLFDARPDSDLRMREAP